MTWWRSLSVLLCVLTALVSARTASALSGVEAENRVKGFLLVAPTLVGGSHAASLGKHLGKSIAYDETASGSCLAAEAEGLGAPQVGDKVFRVYGENNNPLGQSWTRTDPSTVEDFRDVAGLPDVNTGRFVIEGRLTSVEGVTTRSALPLDGNAGGLDEVLIPNAGRQVEIERVSGVNPEF